MEDRLEEVTTLGQAEVHVTHLHHPTLPGCAFLKWALLL